VVSIVDALAATHRLSNTLIAFTSDNGFMWGEHRWVGKNAPYEESIRVPMVVRFDAQEPAVGVSDPHLVGNVDLAPTFAAAAGVAAPGAQGRSLLPLIEDHTVPWRTRF